MDARGRSLTLAYPFRFDIALGPLNSFTIFEIALVLGWGNLIWHQFDDRRRRAWQTQIQVTKPKPRAIDIAIVLYVGFSAISFLWAVSPELAIRGMIPILENVALYYLVIAFCAKSCTRVVTRLFLLLGIVAIILSILYFFAGMSFLELRPASDAASELTVALRLGSPAWGRSNYFATMLLLFLPAYFCITILSTSRWQRLAFGVISAIGLIAFLFTWSRGGWISLAVGVVMLLLLLISRRLLGFRTIFWILVVAAIMGGAFRTTWSFVSDTNPQSVIVGVDRLTQIDDINTIARVVTWNEAWRYGREKPLGLGIGNSALLETAVVTNVHNAFLQSLVEVGWFGLMIYMALLGLMVRENWRLSVLARGTPYHALAIGLLVAIAAVLINILGESSFDGVVFGWLFWCTQAVVRGMYQHIVRSTQSART